MNNDKIKGALLEIAGILIGLFLMLAGTCVYEVLGY